MFERRSNLFSGDVVFPGAKDIIPKAAEVSRP